MSSIQVVYVVFDGDPSDGDGAAEPWQAFNTWLEADNFCYRAGLNSENIRKVEVGLPDETFQECFIRMDREGAIEQAQIRYVMHPGEEVRYSGKYQFRQTDFHYGFWYNLRLYTHFPGNDLAAAEKQANVYRRTLIEAGAWPASECITGTRYRMVMTGGQRVLAKLAPAVIVDQIRS